jgi:hypothetical protein
LRADEGQMERPGSRFAIRRVSGTARPPSTLVHGRRLPSAVWEVGSLSCFWRGLLRANRARLTRCGSTAGDVASLAHVGHLGCVNRRADDGGRRSQRQRWGCVWGTRGSSRMLHPGPLEWAEIGHWDCGLLSGCPCFKHGRCLAGNGGPTEAVTLVRRAPWHKSAQVRADCVVCQQGRCIGREGMPVSQGWPSFYEKGPREGSTTGGCRRRCDCPHRST